MKQVLVCKNCEQELTRSVDMPENVIEHCNLDPRGRTLADSESATPSGKALRIRRCQWDSFKQQEITETVVWLNLTDMLERVELIPKIRNFYGCCGMFGPNSRCKCGVIIGSRYDDCLDFHHFEVFADKTYWMDYVEDNNDREQEKLVRLYANTRNKKRKNRHKKW